MVTTYKATDIACDIFFKYGISATMEYLPTIYSEACLLSPTNVSDLPNGAISLLWYDARQIWLHFSLCLQNTLHNFFNAFSLLQN